MAAMYAALRLSHRLAKSGLSNIAIKSLVGEHVSIYTPRRFCNTAAPPSGNDHNDRRLTITPNNILVDERVEIVLNGLKSGEEITLHANIQEGNNAFNSSAFFRADDNGVVDVTKHASLDGSYTGCDGMGLFWSMNPASRQQSSLRLRQHDVTTPQVVSISAYSGYMPLGQPLESNQEPFLSTDLYRWYKNKDVKRLPIKKGNIHGTLFIPPGDGPFPGIIDLFGSVGGLLEYRASLLASKGFVTLALAYFGYNDLPKSVADVNLDYFKEAVRFLSNQKNVLPGGVGIYGISKGGEIAQLVALHCKQVKAVVSINGAPYLTAYPMQHGDEMIPPVFEIDSLSLTFEDNCLVFKHCFVLDNTNVYPLWKNDVKLLSICGEDDMTTDPAIHHMQYEAYPADQKHKITFVSYEEAGHLIDPPFCPMTSIAYHKVYGVNVKFGGTPAKHAAAQYDAWQKSITFLKETLSRCV